MKKIFFISFLLFSATCFGQKKDTIPAQPKLEIPADSLEFATTKMFEKFIKIIPKLSYEFVTTAKPEDVIKEFYKFCVVEYNLKLKEEMENAKKHFNKPGIK